ncbi:MAG: hypothetical protein LBF97_04905 [Elusimicrobiota bacterium]|jgi:hypothetical protein|nr:hypothetical protein [Elusimicrobiota bacterium]
MEKSDWKNKNIITSEEYERKLRYFNGCDEKTLNILKHVGYEFWEGVDGDILRYEEPTNNSYKRKKTRIEQIYND